MGKRKKILTSVSLSREAKKKLDELSRDWGKPRSHVIEYFIMNYLDPVGVDLVDHVEDPQELGGLGDIDSYLERIKSRVSESKKLMKDRGIHI